MMNPLRGEAKLESGGETYTLALTVNAICSIEAMLDRTFGSVAAELGDPDAVRIGTIRAVLAGMLEENHPNMGLMAAGKLIGEAGLDSAVQTIGACIKAAFPEPGNKQPGKTKAKAATG
jgi:hypothetical protein